MKQKIGITLVVVLNLAFIYLIVIAAILSFGLIVAPLGLDQGLEIVSRTTKGILIGLTIAILLMFLLNYVLFKKLIRINRPIISSLTVGLICVLIFIPFFQSSKQSFIDYQEGTTELRHYLDGNTIDAIQIITTNDTTQIEQLDDFIRDIGGAKHKRGPWKYIKNEKLIITRNIGDKDSLYTNGSMFGPYKGKYFSTNQNVTDKYFEKNRELATSTSPLQHQLPAK